MKGILGIVAAVLLALPAHAGTTINNLPSATTPLTGSELLPIYQGGSTKEVPASGVGCAVGCVINVKNYGVVGDGQMYFDGAMASASSTLTTKQPIASASETGNTVTITLTGNVPGNHSQSSPPDPSNQNEQSGFASITATALTALPPHGPSIVSSATRSFTPRKRHGLGRRDHHCSLSHSSSRSLGESLRSRSCSRRDARRRKSPAPMHKNTMTKWMSMSP